MERTSRIIILFVVGLVMTLTLSSSVSFGKVMFKDNFEKDTLSKPPANWEHIGFPKGYTGGGKSVVDKDPKNPNNKVFHLIPKEHGAGSHDIWAVHAFDKSWTDYVFQWDWLFPEDTYCPVVYRITDMDNYHQLSRRETPNRILGFPGGMIGGAWIGDSVEIDWTNKSNVWYQAQVILEGKHITIKIKERDDSTPMEKHWVNSMTHITMLVNTAVLEVRRATQGCSTTR